MATINIQANLTNGFDSWEVFSRSFTVRHTNDEILDALKETGIVLEENLTDPNEPYYYEDDEDTYQICVQFNVEDYESEEDATENIIEYAEETILNLKSEFGFL